MSFQFTVITLPLFIAALISSGLAIYAWVHRGPQGTISFCLLASALTIWLLAYMLEIASVDFDTRYFWRRISYLGVTAAPLMWFFFSSLYPNQQRRIRIRYRILIALIPFITALLALTNDQHNLIWVVNGIFHNGPFSGLNLSPGPWFWVHGIYSYGLLLVGGAYTLHALISGQGPFRWQNLILLLGLAVPWAINLIYLLKLSPLPFFDLTPFALLISLIAFNWAIFGFRLIQLAPLARNYVIDHMQDGMIVCDSYDRIIDINASALKIWGIKQKKAIGQDIAAVLANKPDLLKHYREDLKDLGEVNVIDGEATRWFEISRSTLRNKQGKYVGCILTHHDCTDRKASENTIRKIYRAVELSHSAIAITSPKGEIQFVNQRFERLTGLDGPSIIRQKLTLSQIQFTPAETHKQIETILAQGLEWHGEYRIFNENGNEVWESTSISPITDVAGVVTNFIAMKDDVSERCRLQEYISRQNKYLSVLHKISLDLVNRRDLEDLLQAIVLNAGLLLKSSHAIVLKVEGENLVVHAATAANNFPVGARFERDQLLLAWQAHDTCQPVIHNFDSREIESLNQDLKVYSLADFPILLNQECVAVLGIARNEPNQPFTEDEVHIGVLFAHLAALVLDNVNLYYSALAEIAERKHSQMLLQESESRYRQIVENASDMIYRADKEGCFTYVNPTAQRLMAGSTGKNLVGLRHREFITAEIADMLMDSYHSKEQQDNASWYNEIPTTTLDGHTRWIGQNVQAIYENGKIAGYQGVARDITERKQAEEALALARDQAVQASQLKSQLLSKVSHELRTPLGVILGYGELLKFERFGPMSEKQISAANQIVDSANFLNQMVNDLLDEAQISARKMVLRMEDFALSDLLTNLESSMQVLANRKELALEFYTSPDMPPVIHNDSARLRQVLNNLITNAIRYTETGSVKVQVHRKGQTHWRIQVADTGVGISKDAQASIFEPFRQIHTKQRHTDHRGTGLGLTITKQLVELMGGTIHVESEPGVGSSFSVTLPFNSPSEQSQSYEW